MSLIHTFKDTSDKQRARVINLDVRYSMILILFLFFFGVLVLEKDSYANPLQESKGIIYALSSYSSTSANQYLIAFETIAKGAWLGGGIKKGGLVTVCSDMDLKKAKTQLPALDIRKIQETKFDQFIVVIVHLGVKPTGGYGIRVRKIVQRGSKVMIEVEDEKYGGGIDAATIPYHILRLRRADLRQTGETTFVLLNSHGGEVYKVTVNI